MNFPTTYHSLEIPRQNAFASVEGEIPQVESLSYGNYFFFADNSMDAISQFSSVNFLVHFILHTTDYPSVFTGLSSFHAYRSRTRFYLFYRYLIWRRMVNQVVVPMSTSICLSFNPFTLPSDHLHYTTKKTYLMDYSALRNW